MSTLLESVQEWIPGDWGNEEFSVETPNPVYCIRGADIVPVSETDYSGIPQRYVSERTKNNKILKAGDIVVEKSGGSPTQSTGRTVYISKELVASKCGNVVCSNFCEAFRVKDRWDSLYVYYYLQLAYNSGVFFNFEGKTSGLKNLDVKGAFKSIKIPDISVIDQKRVACVIAKVESKIALNRKKIEKLEALAKTIYDYWFVQFDFPDANGRPYKSSGGKMVYNPILKREIPDGWEVSSLEKHVDEIVSGEWGNDESSEKAPFQVRCIRGADITDQSNLPIRYISESKQAKLLREGDIIIEMSGGSPTQATGRSCYVTNGLLSENHNMLTCSNFCSALRVLDENETAFFFYTWKLLYDAGVMFNFEGKTSGIKNLQVDSLLLSRWWFPPSDLSAMYNNLFVNLRMSVDSSRKEVRSLTSLRDFLLPLLMNGQVEVDE